MAKNMYIGVDNVARKVKQPNIGVDNVARKVKNGFIGVGNVSRQFFSGGTPLSALSVGTIVKLNESGVAQDYIIVNQGIPENSSLYDASCNGIWLLRKDCVIKAVWNKSISSAVLFKDSYICSLLNSELFAKYDANMQTLIKQVTLPVEGATVSCKVFLLSDNETGITSMYSRGAPSDSAKLSYFDTGNTEPTQRAKRIAYYEGSLTTWWLRGRDTFNLTKARYVDISGYNTSAYYNYETRGVRPTIILPFDALVDENMNIITA